MLGCEDCWREVTAGRDGRALAESLREVAPQHLRERVRTMLAAAPVPQRRRVRLPALLGAVAALAVVLAAGGLLLVVVRERGPAQPAPITAAVARYREGLSAWRPTIQVPPARTLGNLSWRGSGRGVLAGLPVVAHTYQDPTGHRVVLLVASHRFPEAVGLRHASSGATWTAEVDGVVLFCADDPAPSLVLGADQAEVLAAARYLDLH